MRMPISAESSKLLYLYISQVFLLTDILRVLLQITTSNNSAIKRIISIMFSVRAGKEHRLSDTFLAVFRGLPYSLGLVDFIVGLNVVILS